MSKATGNLLYLTAGLAAGVVLGILYAPDEGKNTRDRISFQLGKYRDKLKDMLNKLGDAAHEMPVSTAKSEGEKVIQDTKAEAERLLSDVEALMDQISQLKSKPN